MTDFLFARPSLIDGVMSCVDLFGIAPEYNNSSNAEEADRRARQADILALRNDFIFACNKVKTEYAK